MARRGFRIHSSAVFNPFSYQEMLAPIQQYQTAYDQMQDNMLTLGEEANVYRQLIDTDLVASKTLQGYNDEIARMAGQLSSEGLKAVNRSSLLNIRRKYNNEIKPINDAAKTLISLQDTYRQAYAKDPTMMRGAMPSISELVKNPGAMPHMVSGNDIYKQGAQAAQSASARVYNSDFGRRINGYLEQVSSSGYSPELVAQFVNDVNSIPELARDIQNIRNMYKTSSLDDGGYQADKFIMQGILDGLTYQQKENYVQDWQLHLAQQYDYQKQAADDALERNKELARLKASLNIGGTGSGSGVSYNTINKTPVYIKDGVLVSNDLNSKAVTDAMQGNKLTTPKDLLNMSAENKFQLLTASGLIPDRSMLLNFDGKSFNEGMMDDLLRMYGPLLNSMYIISEASLREDPKHDDEGNRITGKNRIKSNEILLIPRSTIRDTSDGIGGYDYGYDGIDLLGIE